jgi:hypothetical protein
MLNKIARHAATPILVVVVVAFAAQRLLPDHRSCGHAAWWQYVLPFVVFVVFWAFLMWRVKGRDRARRDRHLGGTDA